MILTINSNFVTKHKWKSLFLIQTQCIFYDLVTEFLHHTWMYLLHNSLIQHHKWCMDTHNMTRHWYQIVFKNANTIRLERDSSDENHSDDISFPGCSESISISWEPKGLKLITGIKRGQERNKHTPGNNLDLVPSNLFISYLFYHWKSEVTMETGNRVLPFLIPDYHWSTSGISQVT
jgi:hypothetical protein